MADATAESQLAPVEIHDVLSNERRQKVLELLRDNGHDGSMTARELSERIAEHETGESPPPRNIRQSAYVSLHQTHLPKLDERVLRRPVRRGAAPRRRDGGRRPRHRRGGQRRVGDVRPRADHRVGDLPDDPAAEFLAPPTPRGVTTVAGTGASRVPAQRGVFRSAPTIEGRLTPWRRSGGRRLRPRRTLRRRRRGRRPGSVRACRHRPR